MQSDNKPSAEHGNQVQGEDLSGEIAKTVSKNPGEQVTCRRVSHDHYRCNWWTLDNTAAYDNPKMSGLMVTTSTICQSQFLRVTKQSNALKIQVITSPPAR